MDASWLAERNIPLARIVAADVYKSLKTRSPVIDLDDLRQEAFLGILLAAPRFDPARGVPEKAFLKHRARGQVIDYLRSLDPASRHEREMFRKLAAGEEMSPKLRRKYANLPPIVIESLTEMRDFEDLL